MWHSNTITLNTIIITTVASLFPSYYLYFSHYLDQLSGFLWSKCNKVNIYLPQSLQTKPNFINKPNNCSVSRHWWGCCSAAMSGTFSCWAFKVFKKWYVCVCKIKIKLFRLYLLGISARFLTNHLIVDRSTNFLLFLLEIHGNKEIVQYYSKA